MKAIATTDYGAPATLIDLPEPEPAEGEILVNVEGSSINGIDLAVANGYLQGMMEHVFPVVLGKDFAGTIEAIGPGVEGFTTGDAVFGVVAKQVLSDGCFAERIAAPAGFAAKIPPGLDTVSAGALGLAGAAAHDAIAAIDPQPGDALLVSGATGGVGILATQLLKAWDTCVIATAGTADEIAFVTTYGADATVDHHGNLTAQVRAMNPDGVDAVLHFAGDGAQLAELIASGGRIASTLGFTADHTDRGDLSVATIMANPSTATLEWLADAVTGGAVRVPVAHIYTLAEVPDAMNDFAAGTLGKLAVRTGN